MRLYGLIGYPLTHSFSKIYFTKKFEKENIGDCRYELFPLENILSFPAWLQQEPDLCGLNVTIPHKKSVIPLLDDISGLPEGLHACNCIRIRRGKTEGFNTDWTGFENTLKPLLRPQHTAALVLGTGGASEAVVYVLKKLGIELKMVSRNPVSENDFSYQQITPDIISRYKLIINTTPLGMYPAVEHCPDIPYQALGPAHLLYDLVYNPAQTIFLKRGMAKGAQTQNGEAMLIGQAEAAWKIWNS